MTTHYLDCCVRLSPKLSAAPEACTAHNAVLPYYTTPSCTYRHNYWYGRPSLKCGASKPSPGIDGQKGLRLQFNSR
eukprot:4443867-Pyramimonas_sp.AAC.1